ncbi:MAG TPA: RluA family pseudouridine synthase [Flavilitoribacter sp.]|nr:RluA family pseudouridine synthase [Lewinella sp.]MCB9280740.1 RluA family pseudouridine synthase [Lewinellaceae bacterium]HMQ62511.1 RluA family pseudouridine synthase [Flavilitoribacter sp.]HMQ90685.1 RluA family pseudouridine synthase [Flavilitoribacter sp.]
MQITVLYEDNHLIAVNKPPGWLVQGDATGDRTLADWVKAYIKDRYNKPGDVFLGIVHRIDRPVSGVVVFARTSKALERMNALFRDREVEKNYLAVVETRPDPIVGNLVHYLVKDESRNIVKGYDKIPKGVKDTKKAELSYELIGELGTKRLLLVKPLTGRPHQIRVQLSKIGCPIRGDVKYGFDQPNRDASIHLHCRSLSFVHPVSKQPVTITGDPPDEQIWRLFTLE